MSGGADAILKGMLGIGISTDDSKPPTSSSSGAPAASGAAGADNKKNKSRTSTPQSGKTSRGKPRPQEERRGSGQDIVASGQTDSSDVVVDDVAETSDKVTKNNARKKKKNKSSAPINPATAPRGKAGGVKNVATPSASKNTKENYAWSAFQSSPDPSALPDIGGLFGGDAKRMVGGGREQEKDDREEMNSEDDAGDDDEEKVGASPPYAGMSGGEAFLRQLTSQQANGENDDVGESKVNKTFRTMESVEMEMLSPLKKEIEENNETTTGKSADDNTMDARAAAQKSEMARHAKFQFPDPIMELMNPGGDPGGFGMPPIHHQQYHPQMPYHPPLHYSPQHQYPPVQQQYPGYLYPPQMMHQPPHPYYHQPQAMPPNNIPPGFTTLQVRVPNVLGPGNTMMVHGIHITVPEGIPPGAIIPVMLPIHPPPGRHHTPTNHLPEHYVDPNYYYHHQHQFAQHHHQPQQMMGGCNNINQSQQEQSQQQQSQQHPQAQPPQSNPNSWASKVAATSTPSKSIADSVSQPVATPPLAIVAPAASESSGKSNRGANSHVTHVPVISKVRKEGIEVEAVGAAATSGLAGGGGGTVDKSKNEGVSPTSKRYGKKKKQQKDISGGNSEGNKDGLVATKKSGKK